ncbi:MAG: DUF262 domain-containing protein [Clostridium sp.]|nr:DUF262 domain-containing protein [Clostridium sp.]
MAINIKPVSELLDCRFVIPNYQRGYRWDQEQVSDLLSDLARFQKDASGDDFYCLQPVVVVADPADEQRFTVVDGQQRLTTILLILKNLEGNDTPCFTLEMDQRKEQELFIAESLFASDTADYTANIDNFYVRKAYDTISEWKKQNPNRAKFLSSLLTPDPVKGHASVIWYTIPEGDALEAFRRLNYGKIPLTPAELVKALLLQTDCYGANDIERQRATAQRRSIEWDDMDRRLADPGFSSMVCQRGTGIDSGMEIILDFVADGINAFLSQPFVRKAGGDKRPDNFVFNVIDAKIREDVSAMKLRQDVVGDIWRQIQDTFNLLADWYENREWYHLIGLWRLFSSKKPFEFISAVRDRAFGKNGARLTKPEFTESLRRQIGSEIRFAKGIEDPDLNYDNNNARKGIINILTALNVCETQNDPDGKARFPFDLFHHYKPTSLEHIHPQNITTDISFDEAAKWVRDREADAREADTKVWEKVALSFGWKKPAGEDEELIRRSLEEAVDNAKRRVEESIAALKDLTSDEKRYKDQADEAGEHMKTLDTLFGDMAGINADELHSIANLALVTGPVNSALGNNHLDEKRRILDDLNSRPKSFSKDDPGTFVPPSTLKAFAKGYRPGNPGNMKFWQPEDREAYMKAIKSVYDYFTQPNRTDNR